MLALASGAVHSSKTATSAKQACIVRGERFTFDSVFLSLKTTEDNWSKNNYGIEVAQQVK